MRVLYFISFMKHYRESRKKQSEYFKQISTNILSNFDSFLNYKHFFARFYHNINNIIITKLKKKHVYVTGKIWSIVKSVNGFVVALNNSTTGDRWISLKGLCPVLHWSCLQFRWNNRRLPIVMSLSPFVFPSFILTIFIIESSILDR